MKLAMLKHSCFCSAHLL